MIRFDPIEPHSMVLSGNGTFVKFREVEKLLQDLKTELKEEYGGNGEFAPVYSTLKIVGQRLGVVV